MQCGTLYINPSAQSAIVQCVIAVGVVGEGSIHTTRITEAVDHIFLPSYLVLCCSFFCFAALATNQRWRCGLASFELITSSGSFECKIAHRQGETELAAVGGMR